jgi:preprotein translocase subunit SecE
MFKTNQIKLFLESVIAEYKKVTWPTRQETISVTILVVILVMFFAVYVGMIDFFLTFIMGILVSR